MATLNFKINIKATKQKIWEVLWNDKTYRKWAAAFMEGSYAVSDWQQGSKIQFLDSNKNGMFGIIEKKILNEQIIFKHLGEIKEGKEIPQDWGYATESYFLSENNGDIVLEVTMSMKDNSQFEAYFNHAFPKALKIIKLISENN